MSSFSLQLHAAARFELLEGLNSFVGEDASGSFGILAHHARIITYLDFGLAKLRYDSGEKEYLALPGGILYFCNNELKIHTRDYVRSPNYDEIVTKLEHEFRVQEENLKSIKQSLQRLEEEVFRRLYEMKRSEEY